MDSNLEIGLSDAAETELFEDIDQQAGFDAVPGEERHGLKYLATTGHLTSQRLHQPRQLRIKQVDQRPSRQFGDPTTAGGRDLAAEIQGPAIEALDESEVGLCQQRSQKSVHEFGTEAGYIRIDPHKDVAAGGVQALPERFALAPIRSLGWKNVRMVNDPNPQVRDDFHRTIFGTTVDDDELIEQREAFYELL